MSSKYDPSSVLSVHIDPEIKRRLDALVAMMPKTMSGFATRKSIASAVILIGIDAVMASPSPAMAVIDVLAKPLVPPSQEVTNRPVAAPRKVAVVVPAKTPDVAPNQPREQQPALPLTMATEPTPSAISRYDLIRLLAEKIAKHVVDSGKPTWEGSCRAARREIKLGESASGWTIAAAFRRIADARVAGVTAKRNDDHGDNNSDIWVVTVIDRARRGT